LSHKGPFGLCAQSADQNFEEMQKMIKRIFGCVALCGWLVAGAGLLQAHHSLAGVYDMKNEKEMSGTVASIKFTNPHGSLTLAVKNADGTSTDWVMTMGSATALAQRGIGRTGENALHNGDAIKIRFRPAKDGSPLGFLLLVTMPDGHVIQVAAPNATE
jgi:hypothetical protein